MHKTRRTLLGRVIIFSAALPRCSPNQTSMQRSEGHTAPPVFDVVVEMQVIVGAQSVGPVVGRSVAGLFRGRSVYRFLMADRPSVHQRRFAQGPASCRASSFSRKRPLITMPDGCGPGTSRVSLFYYQAHAGALAD